MKSHFRNPFNGIERTKWFILSRMSERYMRIHSMELKVKLDGSLSLTDASVGIHSMELKVSVTKKRGRKKEVLNPFNGIER